jgi:hypothetical protein
MKDCFKFDMDHAKSTRSRPETSKLIFDPFGQLPEVISGDFFSPNQIVFLSIEESSLMAEYLI